MQRLQARHRRWLPTGVCVRRAAVPPAPAGCLVTTIDAAIPRATAGIAPTCMQTISSGHPLRVPSDCDPTGARQDRPAARVIVMQASPPGSSRRVGDCFTCVARIRA